jgi:hypothetical protein
MVKFSALISLLLLTPNFISSEEIGEKNRFVPLSSWDDGLNVAKINNNFTKISKNLVVDRGYDYNISLSSSNVTLNNVQEDSNYSCMITPNFLCKFKVLQKTTTGFIMVADSTGTGVTDSKFDWIIVR